MQARRPKTMGCFFQAQTDSRGKRGFRLALSHEVGHRHGRPDAGVRNVFAPDQRS